MVAAGAVPREVQVRDPHAAQLETAPHAVIAASLVRRGGDVARPLSFVAPARVLALGEHDRCAFVALAEQALLAPASSFVPTRSSRGPPRS